MTRLPVAAIGPHDLVDRLARVTRGYHQVRLVPMPYDHESETETLTIAAQERTAALLYTGVVPYTIAQSAGLLRLPATYISYSGASLYRALLMLVMDGKAIERISLDTLASDAAVEALEDVGIDRGRVITLPYRRGQTSDDLAAFHRSHASDAPGNLAVTCLRSTYDQIVGGMDAIRLVPALQSMRFAMEILIEMTAREENRHTQVALCLIDADGPRETLQQACAAFGGNLVALSDGASLLITTRGLVERETRGLTSLPLLSEVEQSFEVLRFGFGFGNSAADAEISARRALNHARRQGPTHASLCTDGGEVVDLVNTTARDAVDGGPLGLPVLARRLGMRQDKLEGLAQLAAARNGEPLTAQDVADHFDIEPRAARRILLRLRRSGVAEETGKILDGTSGRPPALYRLHL